jgi:hypothetical protein
MVTIAKLDNTSNQYKKIEYLSMRYVEAEKYVSDKNNKLKNDRYKWIVISIG